MKQHRENRWQRRWRKLNNGRKTTNYNAHQRKGVKFGRPRLPVEEQ